jgi:cytochrome c oxidase cbb3-type subunit 3
MSNLPHALSSQRPSWLGRFAVGVAAALVVIGAGLWLAQARQGGLERRLLTTPPDEISAHPDLVALAAAQGRPLFASHCAGCHGPDMKGTRAGGVPDLTDSVWLYGDGRVSQIERIIMFGIRSGAQKSHDVTEMPAFGQRGQLTETEIDDVVQYVLQLSGQPHDAQAASAGQVVYNGPASCADCHGPDGRGNPDYGAPDLTANTWVNGGDAHSLYNSIYYGRHGVMPGWYGKLTLEQIRALSFYVHAASHR